MSAFLVKVTAPNKQFFRYIRCNSGSCDAKLNDTSKPCEYCFRLGCGFEKR